MNIGRREIALGTFQYIMTTLLSLAVMAIVLSRVSAEEYAIWSVFLAIQSFVVLIDAGFGGVVLRYTSYAICGARKIHVNGTPEMALSGEANFPLVFEIYYYARRVYRSFALLGFGILMMASFYIWYLSAKAGDSPATVSAWMLFSVAVALDMYYTYLSNIMKGMGMIKQNAVISIYVSLIAFAAKVVLVYAGWGLLGLSLAYFIQIAANRLLTFLYTEHLFSAKREIRAAARKAAAQNRYSETYKAIMVNSGQLTLVTVCDFLTGKGKTLLCSVFLPLSITAKFSVTSQLIGIVYSVASLPFSIFRYKFGESIPSGDTSSTKNVFSMITGLFLLFMSAGTVGCVLAGRWALDLIGSDTEILGTGSIILIALYQLTNGITKICTTYIQYKNIQPYVKAVVLSSIAGVVLAIPMLWAGGGLLAYLLTIVGAQLAYNSWKWPVYVYRDLRLGLSELIVRCIRYSYAVLRGTNNMPRSRTLAVSQKGETLP